MADNLREKLPTKDSIIAAEDKVILSRENSNTTVDEFGRITFNEENFPTIFLNTTTDRVAALSSYIETTTVDKLTSFETPEILALQYKHSSNAEGDVIGIAGHAVTDINFEEHVNTIDPIDLTGGLQISKNAATKTIRDRKLASSDILLSPGVYRVECTGTFTLVGIAGGLDENGNVFGNGYKSYVVLELHKETQPGEILLYSTPAVEYSSERNINDTTSSVTCYMYGYISICNPSVLKLKAKTAGEYAIGTVDPDSAGDFPDTFINPVQLVFEKVCDDPFCMEVSSSENDVFPGFIPFETTTLPPVIPPPPPLIPDEDPTVTTTTISPFPGGGLSAAPPPGGSGGGSDPGEGKPRKFSDTISCGSVGFCTSSPFLLGLPKWGYVKPDGSYQRTTIEQAGWSWFGLLKKNPGTVVDADYNSRVIFEGGKRRHNGGIMSTKPDPGDAIIFKTFPADKEYSFSSVASKDRGECDYCREGGIGNPAPTSLAKLVVNKWKHSRDEWCHLQLGDTGDISDIENSSQAGLDESAIEEKAKQRQEEGLPENPEIPDGSGVPGNRLFGEYVTTSGNQLVWVEVNASTAIGSVGSGSYDWNGDGYVSVRYYLKDVIKGLGPRDRIINKTFRDAVNKYQEEQQGGLADKDDTTEEVVFKDDDPGEDKCAVTLTWPCFVNDFGTTGITEDDMKNDNYQAKESTDNNSNNEVKVSVGPNRVAEELEEIFGDVTNIKSRSDNQQAREDLYNFVKDGTWLRKELKETFSTLKNMEDNYVEWRYPQLIGDPTPTVEQAKGIAEQEFNDFEPEIKLLWRTKEGDADDDSKDIAIIFEDKILPLLKNIQGNPPTTYEGIYLNQNILKLFSHNLEIIDNDTPYDTVRSQAEVEEYIKIFTRSISNEEIKLDAPTPFSKFYELSKFIANTKYYDIITNVRPTGRGYAGIEQWRDATNNIPPNIYFNKWWESKVLDNITQDLNSNVFKDLIAGEGKEPQEFNTGNCCMTKNAMITEAYYWNLDQFKQSNDEEYKFIPWWFRFKRSQVNDPNNPVDTVDDPKKPKKKTHKYEQDGIDKYSWIKQPVDLLGIMNHPHPHADTAEATITQRGEFILGCQD